MMDVRSLRYALTIMLSLAAAAWAQEPQFRARVHEVVVPVSVMTQTGKPVETLVASDFLVLNDGVPQRVRMLSRESDGLPVDAVIVLEANDSSEPALAKIKKTASVISSYITNDMETGAPSLAAVITVSDEVRVQQDFTGDPDILADVFEKISATGDSGHLLDGVSLACDMLATRKEPACRVIVLISESRDRGSKTHFANVAPKAQRDDVVIYTLSYSAYATAFTQKTSERQPPPDEPGSYDPNDKGGLALLAIPLELARLAKVNIAQALAQSTGGAHDKFTTLRGLETQLTAIGTEIHNRYTLTFVPPEPQAAGYHQFLLAFASLEVFTSTRGPAIGQDYSESNQVSLWRWLFGKIYRCASLRQKERRILRDLFRAVSQCGRIEGNQGHQSPCLIDFGNTAIVNIRRRSAASRLKNPVTSGAILGLHSRPRQGTARVVSTIGSWRRKHRVCSNSSEDWQVDIPFRVALPSCPREAIRDPSCQHSMGAGFIGSGLSKANPTLPSKGRTVKMVRSSNKLPNGAAIAGGT